MASIWRRTPTQRGAMLAAPAAPSPTSEVGTHSLVAGNGQHMVLPPHTSGQPWIGHKGRTPQQHAFSPSGTFSLHTGGVNLPAASRLRATTPAVINSITGTAAGTYQMAPGGGTNMPAAQAAPKSVGR